MDPNPLPFIEITVSDVSLGSGSFGTVFAGEYGSAQVAIKSFRPGSEQCTDFNKAFQEARIWYKLRHPNIASLYGISKSNDGYPCLVIERFQRTLHNRLMSDPKNVPTLQERIKWLLDISCAYEYLHSCNPPVYHRDLKPDNILLDEHGKAVLTDFGLSTVQSMSSRQRKPRVGHYLYAPPESLVLDYVVTSAYDVYSFGMTAYEVLTRHRPFLGQVQESDPYIVMSWICDGKRPPRCGTKGYRPQADSISDEVWQLINACWEQSPILRPNFSSITSTLKKLSKDLGSTVFLPIQEASGLANSASALSKPISKPNITDTIKLDKTIVDVFDVAKPLVSSPNSSSLTQFQTPNLAKTEANQSSTHIYGPTKKNQTDNARISEELSEALKYLSLSAEKGNADAQNQLGFMYSNGKGTAKDLSQGVKWLHKSAAQGHPMAQHNLSICYFEGNGVEKDVKKAKELLQKSAEQGCSPAMFKLGWRYFKGEGMEANKSEGVKWIQKAADQGLAAAQFRLAWLYEDGNGVEKSEKEAMRLFHLAAEQNYVEAQLVLGAKYSLSGVKEDLVKGTEWYRRAAELGHHEAQNSLGLAYINADGVKRDIEEAKRWLRKAAENGNERAAYHLGLLLSLPPPTYN